MQGSCLLAFEGLGLCCLVGFLGGFGCGCFCCFLGFGLVGAPCVCGMCT
jgi:hypothetical protein